MKKNLIVLSMLVISFVMITECSLNDLKIYKNNFEFDNWLADKKLHWDPTINGEYNVVKSLVKNGDIVFDVGANFGTYTQYLRKFCQNLIVYCFEPVPVVFKFLQENLGKIKKDDYKSLLIDWDIFLKKIGINGLKKLKVDQRKIQIYDNKNKIYLINKALSVQKGEQYFNFYPDSPSVGGIDKRSEITVSVRVDTLDNFCLKHKVNKINYLKIDTEGHDLLVLFGAQNLLKNKQIDYIQFEYMKRCKNAGWNLKQAYEYLNSLDYVLFKIVFDGIVLIDEWRDSLENYQYANFLAVSKYQILD